MRLQRFRRCCRAPGSDSLLLCLTWPGFPFRRLGVPRASLRQRRQALRPIATPLDERVSGRSCNVAVLLTAQRLPVGCLRVMPFKMLVLTRNQLVHSYFAVVLPRVADNVPHVSMLEELLKGMKARTWPYMTFFHTATVERRRTNSANTSMAPGLDLCVQAGAAYVCT